MSAPPPLVTLREGDTIAGKYVVERILGAGGMGVVLAAQHKTLGSRVAIKVLQPATSAIPGAIERFMREARAAAALHSEHVARVMDVGTLVDGMPYLVMEYLTGSDLREVLRARGPLPVEEVAKYMVQVCDAMAEAHSIGIVHRDLKPGNLFLAARPNGTSLVKVLDFGLAKVLDGHGEGEQEKSLTATGLVIGSPSYMSPEQLRGLKLADARSDLWSLGVVMYELLTGKQPFVGEGRAGVLVAIIVDQPLPLRSLRPEIPEAIETLILRCLRKNPDERVQKAQEIAEYLSPFTALRRSAFGLSASLVADDSNVESAVASRGSLQTFNPISPPDSGSASAGAALPTLPQEKPAGDSTMLTASASKFISAGTAGRRSKTLAWIIGGVGAATIGVMVPLVIGPRATAQNEPMTLGEPARASANASQPPGKPSASAGETAASSSIEVPTVASIAPVSTPSSSVPTGEPPTPSGNSVASPASSSPKPSSSVSIGVSTSRSPSQSAASASKRKPNLLKQW